MSHPDLLAVVVGLGRGGVGGVVEAVDAARLRGGADRREGEVGVTAAALEQGEISSVTPQRGVEPSSAQLPWMKPYCWVREESAAMSAP